MRSSKAKSAATVMQFFRNRSVAECLAFDSTCSEKVIRSHSIQNAWVIEQLAVENHVHTLNPPTGESDMLELKKVGRNNATTFLGFCQKHDSEIFYNIDYCESRKLDFNNREQHLLLALRALACEVWKKKNNIKLFSLIRRALEKNDIEYLKTSLQLDDLNIRILKTNFGFVNAFLQGSQVGGAEMERAVGSLMQQSKTGKSHLTRFYHATIKQKSPIAVCSSFGPEWDLEGGAINTLHNLREPLKWVTLNIIPNGDRTEVFMAHHKNNSSVLEPFVSSLLANEERLPMLLSKVVMTHCENFVLSPQYVETCPTEKLNYFLEHIAPQEPALKYGQLDDNLCNLYGVI